MTEENQKIEKAIFAAGCFWGVEATFAKVKGVLKTKVGYIGGITENPTYEDVCSGTTGHAEAVEIEFNPNIISFKDLLDIFWTIHNPTTLNKQGSDIGAQYRSIIFFTSTEQKKEALFSKKTLEETGKYENKIVTEIVPAKEFYEAEEYHQQYFAKTGRAACH